MSDVIITANKGKIFHETYCPYIERIKPENRKQLSEKLVISNGYCECKFCRSTKGLVYYYHKKGYVNVSYDNVDNALCIRTDVGFWKLIWNNKYNEWHLFHMNHKGRGHFDNLLSDKKLMHGSFHRQTDFPSCRYIDKAMRYIEQHDKNYRMAEEDLKNMPKNTPKQRKYYRYHKKRKQRESINHVYKLLDEIHKKEN